MFKVKLEDGFAPPREAPPPRLPIPMSETLAEAKSELAACEARRDWSRAAALKYAAIPHLERYGPRDAPKPQPRARPQAPPQPPPSSYQPIDDLPPWALAIVALVLWTVIAIPLIDHLLISLLTPLWGPIVTVRRGPGDHTGCLELYLSIAIWLFGLIPAWITGYEIGEALRKK